MPNPSKDLSKSINIAGNVTDSTIVVGDGNNINIHVGYRPFIEKFSTKIADLTRDFVGREFLDKELEKFLAENECGYFTLIGEPGIGKSAWAAHVVHSRKAVCHFCEHGHDIATTLSNLAYQISQLFDIPVENPASSSSAFALYFSKVIQEASLKLQEKLVIVIDSLDQLDPSAIETGGNVLLLPRSLPKGVFIVTTIRLPTPNLLTEPETAKGQYVIRGSDRENQADIRLFIHQKLESESFVQYLQSKNITRDEFSQALLKQSAGNFMYLRYQFEILKDPVRFEAGIEGLPVGLHDYYEQLWRALKHEMKGGDLWEITEQIFGLLAVAYDAVDVRWLAAVSNQDEKQVADLIENHISEVLLKENIDQLPVWKIYHQSFRDFLAEKLGDLTRYHRQIADYYHSMDFSTVAIKEVAYGVRNWVKHLEVLGEKDKIFKLVTANEKEPIWVNAHYALTGDYSGYLRDLSKAWAIVEKEEYWDFGRQLHCAVIQASVQSLSANIPLPLMIQAVKHHFWAPEIAIEYVKAFPANSAKRISALFELEPYLQIEKTLIWELAWEWALYTFDENEQGKAFKEFFAFVNDKGKSFILEHVSKYKNHHTRIEHLVALYPKSPESDKGRINDWLWQGLVEIKESTEDDTLKSFLQAASVHPLRQTILSSWRDRVNLLKDNAKKLDWVSQSVSLYEEEKRKSLVSDAFIVLGDIRDIDLKIKVLQRLAPYFSDLQTQQSIEIMRNIWDAEKRSKTLLILARAIPESGKRYVLDEILAISNLGIRLGLLVEIFDTLPKVLWEIVQKQFSLAVSKPKTLIETLPALTKKLPEENRIWAFELAKQIKPEKERAELLARVIVHLPIASLSIGLEEICRIQNDEIYFKAIGRLACFSPVESEQKIFDSVCEKYTKQKPKRFSIKQKYLSNLDIWYLIEFFSESKDVELALFWRSTVGMKWHILMDNYRNREYARFTFTRYLEDEQEHLHRTLDSLPTKERAILFQALLWSRQHFDDFYSGIDWILGDYKKFRNKKHIHPPFLNSLGLRMDLYSLRDFISLPEDNTSFSYRVVNAKTNLDLLKALVLPQFQEPRLPDPALMFDALMKISNKPINRWIDFNHLINVWMRLGYEGIRKNKKVWSQLLHTLASRGLEEFRDDLKYLAPLFIEVGGQKTIQETYEALRDIKTWWATSDI